MNISLDPLVNWEIHIEAVIGWQENMNNILKVDYFFCEIILSPVSKDQEIDPAKLQQCKLSPQL